MEFFKKYGWKVLAFINIPFIIICIVFYCCDFLPAGLNLTKADWLIFCGSFLSFIGSVFLGTVALWQNEKANEVNGKILAVQEKQLGQYKGLLLPIFNDNSKAWNKSQFNFVTLKNDAFYVGFQNRGSDIIHKCEILEKKINGNSIELKEYPALSIENNDFMYFEFNVANVDLSKNISLDLKIKMQNSCGITYIEKLTATYTCCTGSYYQYDSYNFTIEENEDEK